MTCFTGIFAKDSKLYTPLTSNETVHRELFGDTVRYCTVTSGYDTYLLHMLTQCAKSLPNVSPLYCKIIRYNFRAISKSVNNNTQSEEIVFVCWINYWLRRVKLQYLGEQLFKYLWDTLPNRHDIYIWRK